MIQPWLRQALFGLSGGLGYSAEDAAESSIF